MIGQTGATRIQRSAPAARVVRKASTRTDLVAFESDLGAEPTMRRRPPREAEPDEGEYPARSGRKVAPAVLAALLKLKRGG